MLIPVVCAEGVVLVAITLRSSPGKHEDRLEDFLIDDDAVNGLFDAFTAFLILTGKTAKKVPCVDPASAAELKAQNIFIAGDSLGLGILLLLLSDTAYGPRLSRKVCAATGALNVRPDMVVCREVGKLGTKVHSAANAGVDVMYCPVQDDVPPEGLLGMSIKPLSVITKDGISDLWVKVA